MKENCVKCFKTISVKSRFKIFEFLKRKPKTTVSQLVKLTRLRQPTVTFHLNQLVKQGFVKKTKTGRQVFCQTCKKCSPCPFFD